MSTYEPSSNDSRIDSFSEPDLGDENKTNQFINLLQLNGFVVLKEQIP